MTDEVPLQYVIVRYVPDEVRAETINIGVIGFAPGEGTVRAKFVTRYTSLATRYPGADSGLIKTFASAFSRATTEPIEDPQFLERLSSKSVHQIQYTEVRGTLAVDIESEVSRLYDRFVSIDKSARERRSSVSRAGIRRDVWSAVRESGLRDKVRRDFAISGSADRFVFDFAAAAPYADNPQMLIHSLSLDIAEADAIEDAKALAFSIADTRDRPEFETSKFSVVIQPPGKSFSLELERIPRILESARASVLYRSEIPRLISQIREVAGGPVGAAFA